MSGVLVVRRAEIHKLWEPKEPATDNAGGGKIWKDVILIYKI